MNSPENGVQSGVIMMGLSDHELINVLREPLLLKLNEHYKILIRSMKNYGEQIFEEKLRSIKFPDYSNHTSEGFCS